MFFIFTLPRFEMNTMSVQLLYELKKVKFYRSRSFSTHLYLTHLVPSSSSRLYQTSYASFPFLPTRQYFRFFSSLRTNKGSHYVNVGTTRSSVRYGTTEGKWSFLESKRSDVTVGVYCLEFGTPPRPLLSSVSTARSSYYTTVRPPNFTFSLRPSTPVLQDFSSFVLCK